MSCPVIFDREQGVGTCTACGRNFECGAVVGYKYYLGDAMPTKQEVYHSSTLGPIPLSFTGRRLMQNLREAFQELLQKRVEKAKRGEFTTADDWNGVSYARGKLAEYMSRLEKNVDLHPPLPQPRVINITTDDSILRALALTPKKRYIVRDYVRFGQASTKMFIIDAESTDAALQRAVELSFKYGTGMKASDFEVRLAE